MKISNEEFQHLAWHHSGGGNHHLVFNPQGEDIEDYWLINPVEDNEPLCAKDECEVTDLNQQCMFGRTTSDGRGETTFVAPFIEGYKRILLIAMEYKEDFGLNCEHLEEKLQFDHKMLETLWYRNYLDISYGNDECPSFTCVFGNDYADAKIMIGHDEDDILRITVIHDEEIKKHNDSYYMPTIEDAIYVLETSL